VSSDPHDIDLHEFTDLDQPTVPATYVAAPEAFDRLPLLGELKELAVQRTGTGPGTRCSTSAAASGWKACGSHGGSGRRDRSSGWT
jgi:hypothetical protein